MLCGFPIFSCFQCEGRVKTFVQEFAFLFQTPEQGAETVLYAALSPEAEGQTGCYYDNCDTCDSAGLTYDLDFQATLLSKTTDLIASVMDKEQQ